MTDEIVDARGLACPEPVIATRRALADEALTAVAVLVDNEASAENVARMARSLGCEVRLEDGDGPGELRVVVERAAAGAGAASDGAADGAKPAGAPESADACGTPSDVVVLLSAQTVGRGDEDLGRLLALGFVKTLKEVVPRPRTLVFMNGGVRLVVEGSELVPAVAELERSGVTVLVCGTCLDFFGLKEKLAAGRVSNMFEILSTLVAADRVVRP